MYITSELFTSPSAAASPRRNGTEGSPTGLGKRKRRVDDGDSNADFPSSHKAKPQFVGSKPLGFASPGSQYTYPRFTAASLLGTRPIKQARRTNQRTIMNTGVPPPSETVPNAQYLIPPTHPTSSTYDLRPCHICHKAPIRWRDVENYTMCQDCDGRVCYVCARTCAGPVCGRELCSRCCKELGKEGEAWCTKCAKTGHGS